MTVTTAIVDLSKLDPPTIVEQLDYETILARKVARMQALFPDFDATVDSDPAMKVLQVAAYDEILLRQDFNERLVGRLLAWDMRVTRAKVADTALVTNFAEQANVANTANQSAREGGKYFLAVQPDAAGVKQIFAQNITDGRLFQVTKGATDNTSPSIDRTGNRVVFASSTGDRVAMLTRDIGQSYPAVASRDITGIGDSFTAFSNTWSHWMGQIGVLPGMEGRALIIRGVGGDEGSHIAFRMGAIQNYATVDGNAVPESGAVAITASTTAIRQGNLAVVLRAPSGDIAGTLTGTLSGTTTTLTFTRTTNGPAVAVPPGTEIVSSYADAARSTIRVISSGVNDQGQSRSAQSMIDYIIALMDDQRTVTKKTIVMGQWCSLWMRDQRNLNIAIVNAAVSAACAKRGMIFLDTRGYIMSNVPQIMADNGLTPTTADLEQIARNVIPASLRPANDDTHIASSLHNIWARQVADVINSKGY